MSEIRLFKWANQHWFLEYEKEGMASLVNPFDSSEGAYIPINQCREITGEERNKQLEAIVKFRKEIVCKQKPVEYELIINRLKGKKSVAKLQIGSSPEGNSWIYDLFKTYSQNQNNGFHVQFNPEPKPIEGVSEER